jgi:hypothetical protein
MTAIGKAADMLAALKSSADDALRRLSGADPAARTPIDEPRFDADPTRAFFSGEGAGDEHQGSLSLSALLEQSAHAMARREDDLREPAGRLAALIEDRREGEVTMAAQALRVVIGLVWFAVAGWLYWSVLNARAGNIGVVAGGVPLGDAAVLARTFIIVAAVAVGVAFAVAALTRALGNADNGRIRRQAGQFGAVIAEASGEFDAALSSLRGAMDRRDRPADAVDDLSRAHLTALEAHAFFREISFLTGPDDDHAQRQFRGFLARAAGTASGGGVFSTFLALLAGAVIGAFAVYVAAVPKPEPAPEAATSALAIMQYPWAAQIIVLGGLAYAGIGAALSFVAGPLTEGVARAARADALTAIRSGFASDSAMRPEDVARRIRDAVDVFRARVGGGGARTPGPGANHAGGDFSDRNDIPEWRRRDSSVKFVDAGFSPAPERWRTDAYAKKFEAPEGRSTGSKRDGEDLKKRTGD